jgi:hypothetical protein
VSRPPLQLARRSRNYSRPLPTANDAAHHTDCHWFRAENDREKMGTTRIRGWSLKSPIGQVISKSLSAEMVKTGFDGEAKLPCIPQAWIPKVPDRLEMLAIRCRTDTCSRLSILSCEISEMRSERKVRAMRLKAISSLIKPAGSLPIASQPRDRQLLVKALRPWSLAGTIRAPPRPFPRPSPQRFNGSACSIATAQLIASPHLNHWLSCLEGNQTRISALVTTPFHHSRWP